MSQSLVTSAATVDLAVVPRGMLDGAHGVTRPTMVQPVDDVAKYLEERRAVKSWKEEQSLFIKIPGAMRPEIKALQSACEVVAYESRTTRAGVRPSVQRAIKDVLQSGFACWHWNLKTFRAMFDAWVKDGDWLVFVNRSKAGAEWQKERESLSDAFLMYCAARIGKYKREDGRKEALRSIKRQWISGRTMEGRKEAIPGYGFAQDWWTAKGRPIGSYPPGWHYSNIMRQLKARNTLPKAAAALLLQGTSLAKEFVPDVISSRGLLRFMEEVQFDDLKTDFRIFDPATKQSYDLWLLIARDRATGLLLGFGMRPARVREDGSQEHLKLRDMKQLAGWLLERFGLPPYLMVWKLERGTATLSEGSILALRQMLPDRIDVKLSSMVGGTSPAGYFERRIGNSKGKASLESHNRGIHLIGAGLPGQTGPTYGKRPSDLLSREKECREIAELSSFLPEHLRGQMGYSLLTLAQARTALFEIFRIQNERDDHNLEGFETILEWYDPVLRRWRPQNEFQIKNEKLKIEEPEIRQRKETPVERAAKLIQSAGGKWSRVSPDIITAFYEHTQRPVTITDAGEIEFTFEGRKLIFVRPDGAPKLPGNAKLLAYYHPDDPAFIHLIDKDKSVVGTWLQRSRATDAASVSQAIAYQARALRDARQLADALNAPERAELEAMRSRNAEITRGFVEVTPAQAQQDEVESSVAKALAGIGAAREEVKEQKHQEAVGAAAAILANDECRMTNDELGTETDPGAGDELLKALTGK